MAEFLQACFAPANLVLTVLLGLCILYWLLVIIGGLSSDSLDVDVDGGVDVDADVDADMDVDAGADVDAHADVDAGADADAHADAGAPGAHGGLGLAILRFCNLGTVPLMVVLSVLILAMWTVSVSLYPWIGNWSVAVQFAMLVPIFLAGLLIAKIVTAPLKVLFRKLREEEKQLRNVELVGQRCRVVSHTAGATWGQAELATAGAPMLLNVCTGDAEQELRKGDEAVIVAYDQAKGTYTVREFKLEVKP